MRGLLICLIAALFVPAAASGATTQPATSAAEETLNPIIPAVDFRDVTIEQAVEKLRDMTGVNVVVRWRDLEKAGLPRDARVDLRMTKLPLQRVLELLGEAAGASGMPLAAGVDRGVVVLGTEQDLNSATVVRLYDVRDLVASDVAFRAKVDAAWRAAGTTRPAQPQPPYYAFPGDNVGDLTMLITEMIEPESWVDAGGTIGGLRMFNGRLVIKHTPAAHERIAKLLDDLRQPSPPATTRPAVSVRE